MRTQRFLGFLFVISPLILSSCSSSSHVAETTSSNAPPKQGAPGALNQPANKVVAESVNRLLVFEQKVLPSYRVTMHGVEPQPDVADKSVRSLTFDRTIDFAGDDARIVSHLVEKGERVTREGFVIGGTNASTMKDYEMKRGTLEPAGGMVGMGFALLPMRVGMPVSIAAQGASAQGSESIEGRRATKYALDSAKVAAGALELIAIKSFKGTAWVDEESGTLLKLDLDYEQEFSDAKPPTTSKAHLDLLVSQVGQVKVELPR